MRTARAALDDLRDRPAVVLYPVDFDPQADDRFAASSLAARDQQSRVQLGRRVEDLPEAALPAGGYMAVTWRLQEAALPAGGGSASAVSGGAQAEHLAVGVKGQAGGETRRGAMSARGVRVGTAGVRGLELSPEGAAYLALEATSAASLWRGLRHCKGRP